MAPHTMPAATNQLYKHVMHLAGFYWKDRPTQGVYHAADLRRATTNTNADLIDRWFRYAPLIDGNRLDVTDVYEWSGNSCAYFKAIDTIPDPDEFNRQVAQWHRATWNNGLARMLWVVTPTEVRVFNAYAKPPDSGQVIDNPEVQLFQTVASQLVDIKKARLLRRDIESGAFWESDAGKRIDKDHRVDHELLDDLRLAANNLRQQGLDSPRAHRLLLQTIFVAFLEARGLLPKSVFDGLKANSFADVVADVGMTRRFFNRMHKEFDADLFPALSDDDAPASPQMPLTGSQLHVVWRILNKTDQNEQQRFWPYDFRVVPIELISSIYEDFLRTQDEKGAEEHGVHYTPLNLVHLVLSEVLDSSVPLDAKVLDLSCGSGVFLVEALRRLVARRIARGEPLSRKLIRDVLYNQIFGVDIKSAAVEVAAFSLCLTALELEPSHANGSPIRFPRPLTEGNLFAADAFDRNAPFNSAEPFKSKSFSVVVGNPPWTSPKGKGSRNAAAVPPKHIKYCQTCVPPFPLAHDNPPDPAFFRRAQDFSQKGAKFGMIVAATRFYSQQEDSQKVKRAIFSRYRPRVVINLSQVHRDLFPNAQQPALVLIAENTPATESDTFTLFSVERSKSFKNHGAFEIGPESARHLPVLDVATKMDALKVASWGTARDWVLVQKLLKCDTLSTVLKNMGVTPCSGYNHGTPWKPTPAEMLGKKHLSQDAFHHCGIQLSSLPKFDKPKLEAPRDPKIYRAPLLLIANSLVRNRNRAASAYVNSDVIYSKMFTGIPVTNIGHRDVRFLNGILNSAVVTYFLFLSSPAWGVERYTLRQTEWMLVPIPSLADAPTGPLESLLEAEKALRDSAAKGADQSALLPNLDRAAYDLYGLSRNERALVEDMLDLTIDFQCEHEASAALQACTATELERYAAWVIRNIDPILQSKREYTLNARIFDWPRTKTAKTVTHPSRSLRAVEFSFVKGSPKEDPIDTVNFIDLDAALDMIANELDEELVENLYTRRHLRIYDDNRVYVIKPDQKRCWSRSAALSDADAIIADHLGD